MTENESENVETAKEPEVTSVKPDEVIKPIINDESIKELAESINELKAVQKQLYEQQNILAMKGADNEENELTY